MFALVDVNNMYVSCERVFRPALIGRPVVVLSNNDGACIARSNEAKDLGVRMAQPWFEVRHLEREAGLIALSANFELYGDMSSRMMALAAAYAPRQEIYSIDECFLDFEGVPATWSPSGATCAPRCCVDRSAHEHRLRRDQDVGQAGQPRRQDGRSQAGTLPAAVRAGVQLPRPVGGATARRAGCGRRRRRLGHRPQDGSQAERSRHPDRARPAQG
jgi:nucleotidyltransferase/DNA polymerase involved in DNA repair